MTGLLRDIAASISSPVEARVFAEYGAVFLTTATPPSAIIFTTAEQVERFQASLPAGSGRFGEHVIELQEQAIESLTAAASELSVAGLSLTARAADAGRRSYDDTARLWNRNVARGLEHWQEENRLAASRAGTIRELALTEQVAAILELEQDDLYFGTYFDRSILHSVAAPGTSQHLSMLAFDVAEYQEAAVEGVLGTHGWFRTVVNDLPHFTFLGRREDELTGLGLKRVRRSYGETEYQFWVPDI